MTHSTIDQQTRPSCSAIIPPLESGDRLSRGEFERRYDEMPEKTKAELIQGVVYVNAAAVRAEQHGGPHGILTIWLGQYVVGTDGVRLMIDTTIRLSEDTVPQPDVTLFIDTDYGGKVGIASDGYLEGAPELVAEVAASSVSYDLHDKLNACRNAGIEEYLVWRVLDEELDWFRLREGRYEKMAPDESGSITSGVFSGLRLDVAALLRSDVQAVAKTLDTGLASTDHSNFVEILRRKALTRGGAEK